MALRTTLTVIMVALFGCGSSSGGGTGGGAGGGSGGGGGGGAGGTATCMDTLKCVAACASGDTACIDACDVAASTAGRNQLLDLLSCMDTNQCAAVSCVETNCGTQLNTCVTESTTSVGTAHTGGVPSGNVPAQLVGHWTSPSSSEVVDLVLNADGSATYSRYKESWLSACGMAVTSSWPTGSASADATTLTVTLAAGTTTVAWIGGCGSNYQNPAGGKVLRFSYALDTTSSPWMLSVTDLDCTAGTDYCRDTFKKN